MSDNVRLTGDLQVDGNLIVRGSSKVGSTGYTPVPTSGVEYAVTYGVVADGSTDDTDALQRAVNGTRVNGVLVLPKGQMVVSRLDINKAITLQGWGEGATFLCPSTDQDCIRLNAASTTKVSNILLRDFHIAPKTSSRASGVSLLLGNIGDTQIHNVKISSGLGFDNFVGIKVENASNVRILCHISDCASDGIQFSPNATAETGIVDVFLEDSSYFDANAGHGISIANTSTAYACEGIYIGRCTAYGNTGDGIRVANTASCTVKHIFLNGTIIDTNGGIGFHQLAGGAEIQRIFLTDVWVSNNGSHGIYFQAQSQICQVVGGRVLVNELTGIVCDGCDDVMISNVHIYNNSQTTTNTYDAIQLKNTPTNIQIIDCIMFNDAEFGAGQQNGLNIDTGTNILVSGGFAITGAGSTPFDSGTATGLILDDFTYGTTYALASTHTTPENVTTTNVGNITTGEDDLMTYSLPANTLKNAGQGVRITAWGTAANTAAAKTLKLYFGVAILTTALTANQAGTWRITAEVFKTGASAQDYVAQLNQGGTTTLVDVEQGTLTQTDTAAITIKCTGDATNTDDIVQGGLLVECIG